MLFVPPSMPAVEATCFGDPCPPLERFSFENRRVVDEFGASVPEVTVGQQIQIVADIMNLQDNNQHFAYVVTIGVGDTIDGFTGSDDEYVVPEWVQGSLDRFESTYPAVSWTPSAPGNYIITLAVWVGVDDPSALAPMQTMSVDVIPKSGSFSIPEPATAIPEWIKNNAGWWAEGQIDDSSFLQGIQFLIKEGIMVIPPTEASGTSGSEGVPAWVKNNAGWWAEGQIDDSSFLQGIQFLIKEGIIKVS